MTYKVTSVSLRDTDIHLRRLGSDDLSSYSVLAQKHLTTISLVNGHSGTLASHLRERQREGGSEREREGGREREREGERERERKGGRERERGRGGEGEVYYMCIIIRLSASVCMYACTVVEFLQYCRLPKMSNLISRRSVLL